MSNREIKTIVNEKYSKEYQLFCEMMTDAMNQEAMKKAESLFTVQRVMEMTIAYKAFYATVAIFTK